MGLSTRIEAAPAIRADVITARALASLRDLLTFAYPHLAHGGQCIFPKGADFRREIFARPTSGSGEVGGALSQGPNPLRDLRFL